MSQNTQKSSNHVFQHIRNTTRKQKRRYVNCTKTNAASQHYCHVNSTGVSPHTELQLLMAYWNKGESPAVKTLRTAAAPCQRLSDDMQPVTLSGYTVVAPPSSRCVANRGQVERKLRMVCALIWSWPMKANGNKHYLHSAHIRIKYG